MRVYSFSLVNHLGERFRTRTASCDDDAAAIAHARRFEREFGAIIGRLDLIANLLGENSRRIGINYAQGLLLFNFLPVR